MSTSKQIAANQLNSMKSTGPTTQEGKNIVSKNAVKHGLLSDEVLLPWETDAELQDLKRNLHKL